MSGSFNIGRVLSIARKEIFHILRDPFTLALSLGLPVILVTVFGFAIDFNVKDIGILVQDGDRTQSSRSLTQVFSSSGYFRVGYGVNSEELLRALDSEQTKGAMIIEPGFEKKLAQGIPAVVQIILDGADNSTAGTISGYLRGIQTAAASKLVANRPPNVLQVKTRYLFNPELNSQWFVVPGLAVVLVAILSVLLTALTVAREWEHGSMELLLSTPVRPLEIILGKLVPYAVLGSVAFVFIYGASRLGFGVPFTGSHLALAVAALLFQIGYLAIGLFISVMTRKQQLAMQLGLVFGLLPSMLLSGFIFPIESMPPFFQALTSVFPAKWFMIAMRATFLKGAGFQELSQSLLALAIIDLVVIFLASKKFKQDLEP